MADEASTKSSALEEKRMLELLEGQKVLVKTGSALPTSPPSWYDAAKFRRGQDFVRKNYAGIAVAHFLGLITMLISPSITKVLIYTRKSETVIKSFKRYVATVVHVTAWYYGNVFEPLDEAHRSLQMVNGMHSGIARASNDLSRRQKVDSVTIEHCGQPLDGGQPMLQTIHQDVQSISNCPYAAMRDRCHIPSKKNDDLEHLYLNQFDMADTQFAFVGIIVLFPKKFGFIYSNEEDLAGFIHFWRCIGYYLGIEDRYNLCHDDDVHAMRNLCRHYLDNMIKPAFKEASSEYEHMARAVADGARPYNPGVTFESLYAYYAYVVDLPATNFIRRMSFAQYFHYLYLRSVFILCWIPGFMAFFSWLTRFIIGLVVDRSNEWWPKSWNPPQIDGLQQLWTLTRTR